MLIEAGADPNAVITKGLCDLAPPGLSAGAAVVEAAAVGAVPVAVAVAATSW
jgi:hypothetical protein